MLIRATACVKHRASKRHARKLECSVPATNGTLCGAVRRVRARRKSGDNARMASSGARLQNPYPRRDGTTLMFDGIPPLTRTLIGINVVAFLAELFLGNGLIAYLALWPIGTSSVYQGLPGFQPWQIVTY